MMGNAFTAGVKPGGLTTTTEIRILLCWLAARAKPPLTRAELETALLGEELVNYFELANHLTGLCERGFLREENGRYTILPAGAEIAAMLGKDLPRSVRETAERAADAAQRRTRLQKQHPVRIVPAASGQGFHVEGALRDMDSDIFSFSLFVPDEKTAQQVRGHFIEKGDEIYRMVLSALTDDSALRSSS